MSMTVKELIVRLLETPPEADVLIGIPAGLPGDDEEHEIAGAVWTRAHRNVTIVAEPPA